MTLNEACAVTQEDTNLLKLIIAVQTDKWQDTD